MFDLILGAGLTVKAVLLLLVLASVGSWAIILFKLRELGQAEHDTEQFLDVYLERPIDAVYDAARRFPASPLATLFQSGFKDLAQLERLKGSARGIPMEEVEGIVKRLGWIQTEEAHRLERGLPFLATVGSAAPFVGLFGTVVGIMNAFADISERGSASLVVVGGGIAEALVATAVGLFAAIPAVIAYNYSNARLARLIERLDAFRAELESLLRRRAASAA
ncbi:MAG: MotA/TolQ/ExbB proton channel family protein [Myxococcota bacterium]